MKRVVITGLGAVTPLGATLPETMLAISNDATGVKYMPEWANYSGLRSQIAAPAQDPDCSAVPRHLRRSMGRMSYFALMAAKEALTDARIAEREFSANESAGCVIGSTMGSAISINDAFERLLPSRNIEDLGATTFFKCVSHTAAMNVCQCLGVQGALIAPAAACASGLQAVGVAYDLIRLGRQSLVLCGGAEELHPTVTASFDVLYAASAGFNTTPGDAPRPFDRDRDGLVCGEGAGILLLEEYDRAQARGARIYGEIAGFHSCSGGAHVSESDRSSIARCLRAAMTEARLEPQDIDFVSAHATATLQGDREEAAALRELFGDRVPVSSLKGHLGHTLGASGPIELAACLMLARDRRFCPTRNLHAIGADCDGLRHMTAWESLDVRTLLKNSFAFGGVIASMVVRLSSPPDAQNSL